MGAIRLTAPAALALAGAALLASAAAAFEGVTPSPLVLDVSRIPLREEAAYAAPVEAPLALANPYVLPPEVDVKIGGGTGKKTEKPAASSPRRTRRMPNLALTPERAQALLRSMAVPGWGQATLGRRTSATVFGVLEAGIWGTFAAFRIQERLRLESSTRTARTFAGVDLHGRDEEFRKLVGTYASSEEYNQLVVMRDAANLYYDEPERYRDYIATHSLGGALTWSWQDEASFRRYQSQRRDATRASQRANTALACAVGNRILSVLHTARVAGRPNAAKDTQRSWRFEVTPAGGEDPTAYRFQLRTSF